MNDAVKVVPASIIAGDEVESPDGKKLGTIINLMIDMEQGRIAYAVLSFGGLFGIGRKFFAVPWRAITLRKNRLVLDVTREALRKVPDLNEDELPEAGDRIWAMPNGSRKSRASSPSAGSR